MASVLSKKQKRYSLAELKTLGTQLLSSRAHVNNLPILMGFITPSSKPVHALESLICLRSFFTPLLPELPPSSFSNDVSIQEDPELIYRTWLRSKFDEFVLSLIHFSVSPLSDETLREEVVDSLMECVKDGNGGKFHSSIFHKFIHSIVYSTSGNDNLLNFLFSKYFKYIDVRYFTFISLEKLTRSLDMKDSSDGKNAGSDAGNDSQSKASMELSIYKIHLMLSNIPPLEKLDDNGEYEMWNGLGLFFKEGNSKEQVKSEDKKGKTKKSSSNVVSSANVYKKMKLKFSKAWISFLGLPLPIDVYKEVLVSLHQTVIPNLSNPMMLFDFLTRSYDIGGVISVMALSSLFILMTEHGLEYPDFYTKLYALLEPSIFMAKHRARFFQLLDSCLKSPLLPAYLAAAFAKKLSRLALSVPPSGSLIIIALIHNLLRRHPSINCLVHQGVDSGPTKDNSESENKKDLYSNNSGIDPFNNEEADLVKTNALRSSLWEIDTLRHHYCPPVSAFVLSLETDLTARAKTTEVAVKDFSSGSYATIFREEIRRRVKQVPFAFYKTTPTSLFSESDFAGWTFKLEDGVAKDDKISNELEEHDGNFAKRQRIECVN